MSHSRIRKKIQEKSTHPIYFFKESKRALFNKLIDEMVERDMDDPQLERSVKLLMEDRELIIKTLAHSISHDQIYSLLREIDTCYPALSAHLLKETNPVGPNGAFTSCMLAVLGSLVQLELTCPLSRGLAIVGIIAMSFAGSLRATKQIYGVANLFFALDKNLEGEAAKVLEHISGKKPPKIKLVNDLVRVVTKLEFCREVLISIEIAKRAIRSTKKSNRTHDQEEKRSSPVGVPVPVASAQMPDPGFGLWRRESPEVITEKRGYKTQSRLGVA